MRWLKATTASRHSALCGTIWMAMVCGRGCVAGGQTAMEQGGVAQEVGEIVRRVAAGLAGQQAAQPPGRIGQGPHQVGGRRIEAAVVLDPETPAGIEPVLGPP